MNVGLSVSIYCIHSFVFSLKAALALLKKYEQISQIVHILRFYIFLNLRKILLKYVVVNERLLTDIDLQR
jgi:hypothetical protein